MFGVLCIMVNEKMLLSIDIDKITGEDRLMLRFDPDSYATTLSKYGAREMNFTGKPVKVCLY